MSCDAGPPLLRDPACSELRPRWSGDPIIDTALACWTAKQGAARLFGAGRTTRAVVRGFSRSLLGPEDQAAERNAALFASSLALAVDGSADGERLVAEELTEIFAASTRRDVVPRREPIHLPVRQRLQALLEGTARQQRTRLALQLLGDTSGTTDRALRLLARTTLPPAAMYPADVTTLGDERPDPMTDDIGGSGHEHPGGQGCRSRGRTVSLVAVAETSCITQRRDVVDMDARRVAKISKYLAKHLRHRPERLGLELERGGWVEVDVLLAACRRASFELSHDELVEVVERNDKRRFSFDAAGTRIRASQGHSVTVDLQLEPATPPEVLYHGTGQTTVEAILIEGLKPMGRHHVHLSADVGTAIKVGARHGRPTVLQVDAGRMHADGVTLFRAENEVWLTDHVAVDYLDVLT